MPRFDMPGGRGACSRVCSRPTSLPPTSRRRHPETSPRRCRRLESPVRDARSHGLSCRARRRPPRRLPPMCGGPLCRRPFSPRLTARPGRSLLAPAPSLQARPLGGSRRGPAASTRPRRVGRTGIVLSRRSRPALTATPFVRRRGRNRPSRPGGTRGQRSRGSRIRGSQGQRRSPMHVPGCAARWRSTGPWPGWLPSWSRSVSGGRRWRPLRVAACRREGRRGRRVRASSWPPRWSRLPPSSPTRRPHLRSRRARWPCPPGAPHDAVGWGTLAGDRSRGSLSPSATASRWWSCQSGRPEGWREGRPRRSDRGCCGSRVGHSRVAWRLGPAERRTRCCPIRCAVRPSSRRLKHRFVSGVASTQTATPHRRRVPAVARCRRAVSPAVVRLSGRPRSIPRQLRVRRRAGLVGRLRLRPPERPVGWAPRSRHPVRTPRGSRREGLEGLTGRGQLQSGCGERCLRTRPT